MTEQYKLSKWVDLPLLLDWTLFNNSFGTATGGTPATHIYDGASQDSTPDMMLTAGETTPYQRLVNWLPATEANGRIRLRKREQADTPSGFNKGVSVASPRGIFWINNLRRLVELWTSTLYLQTADDTYTTQTGFGDVADGPGGFCEGLLTAGTAFAFVSTTDQSVTIDATPTITVINDTDFPAAVIPMPVFLDGYVFIASDVAGNRRRIYNSVVGTPTSWTATGFTEAEEGSGSIAALVRHHRSVVALCRDRIEFFKNGAIPAPNSPLVRESEHTQYVGCVNRATVATFGNITYFVGRDNRGRLGVYKLEEYKLTKVSNPSIDLIMRLYGGVNLNFDDGQSFDMNVT
ncbi:MAG: hypothetical protein L0287_17915, partial [Anaerolineae bacterium]|nr:hypothetical protein [Anaerolineae bacterium]